MTRPTNLTDRIAQLREKKSVSSILNPNQAKPPSPNPSPKPDIEKPLAFDAFTCFAYLLLFLALIGQLFLIISLDLF